MTYGLEGRCSIQLSYERVIIKLYATRLWMPRDYTVHGRYCQGLWLVGAMKISDNPGRVIK